LRSSRAILLTVWALRMGGGGQYNNDWFVPKSVEVNESLVKAKCPNPHTAVLYSVGYTREIYNEIYVSMPFA